MKRVAAAFIGFLCALSLASCSEANKKSYAEKPSEPVSNAPDTTLSTEIIETTTTKQFTELIFDDLDCTYDCPYYSFKYPSDWKIKGDKKDDPFPRFTINEEASFSIGAQKNKYFTEMFNTIPTNQDYIDFLSTNYGSYDKYVPEGSIGFAFTEDKNSFYNALIYRFYSYDLPFEISFLTDFNSNYYFSQNSIDKILSSFVLHEVSEPYEDEYTTIEATTSAPSLSFSGSGDFVSEAFSAKGCTRLKGTYTGEGTFFVTLYDDEANFEALIFSNMGEYSGEKVFQFKEDKKYLLEVTSSSGDWNISIE